MQVNSLSYHAGSGNIAIGLDSGHVEMWQTAPYIAPQPAPLTTRQSALPFARPVALDAVPPAYVCVRARLVEAQANASNINAVLGKSNDALRQQMSREQELKRSIAALEAKCAQFIIVIFYCLLV